LTIEVLKKNDDYDDDSKLNYLIIYVVKIVVILIQNQVNLLHLIVHWHFWIRMVMATEVLIMIQVFIIIVIIARLKVFIQVLVLQQNLINHPPKLINFCLVVQN